MAGQHTLTELWSSYPIATSILDHLSATDASVFLSVTGWRWKMSRGLCAKYLSIYRDIPEHEGWIKEMISKGHTVLLAGAGLDMLLFRYLYPLRYWREGLGSQRLIVWLIPLALTMSKNWYEADWDDELANGIPAEFPFITHDSVVNWTEPELDGQQRFVDVHYEPCLGALCGNTVSVSSILLPGPTLWPRCYLDWHTPHTWNRVRLPNDNNVRLVCATDISRDHSRMNLNLNPDWNPILYDILPGSMPDNSIETILQNPEEARITYMNLNTGEVHDTEILDNIYECNEDGSFDWRDTEFYDPHSIIFPYSPKPMQRADCVPGLAIKFYVP